MSSNEKDLATVFEEMKTEITTVKEKLGTFEEQLKTTPTKEDLKSFATKEDMKKIGEQAKPYGKPYGEPFIKSVIALIKKAGAKTIDELIDKLQKMTGEELERLTELPEFESLVKAVGEQARFISAEDEDDCKKKGGEWKDGRCLVVKKAGEAVEASAIAKTLKYLKGKLDAKQLKHVTKLLGVAEETADEMLKPTEVEELRDRISTLEQRTGESPNYILPTGERLTDKTKFMDEAKKLWEYGREHQGVVEG